MIERSADFEWRAEGESAEVVIYAPDAATAGRAFGHALPAASLPEAESPVYVAASGEFLGWAVSSPSYVSPALLSAPSRGVLLVADLALENLGVASAELPRLFRRNLAEVRVPSPSPAALSRFCESGALAAAEEGLVEAEDLETLGATSGAPEYEGDADALGRRALAAASRDWDRLGIAEVFAVGEVLDSGRAEALGVGRGSLVLALRAGSGDLGRLALKAHRERVERRESGGSGPAAATVGAGEAADVLAASRASANFAAARASLLVYAARRALAGVAGGLDLRASWSVGGAEEAGSTVVHRRELAAVGQGEVAVCGSGTGGAQDLGAVLVAGGGGIPGSAPLFGVAEDGGRWPWEEAGVLERAARLEGPEGGG